MFELLFLFLVLQCSYFLLCITFSYIGQRAVPEEHQGVHEEGRGSEELVLQEGDHGLPDGAADQGARRGHPK